MFRIANRLFVILTISVAPFFGGRNLCGQEPSGDLIGFDRDIRPILASKCLECHGPDDAKGDFRVDDEDTLLAYIEAGEDAEDSSLWSDYLVTDDEDTHMPPPERKQLTGTELAAIKLWIEEGASWEAATVAGTGEVAIASDEVPEPEERSFADSAWTFQGLFHPVSVHLPVGLLSVSTIFLFLSLKFGNSFRVAAFHCLWVGALGAVGACVSGWAYAQHEGYGAYGFDVIGSNVDRHRWVGILTAIASLAMIPLAKKSYCDQDDPKKFKRWLLASILVMFAVSATGYWGGELIYGEDHYFKEFSRLFLDNGQ